MKTEERIKELEKKMERLLDHCHGVDEDQTSPPMYYVKDGDHAKLKSVSGRW